jgi:hypothetical protein
MVKIEAFFEHEKLDSNGNYFDWGPGQWAEDDTDLSERMRECFWR